MSGGKNSQFKLPGVPNGYDGTKGGGSDMLIPVEINGKHYYQLGDVTHAVQTTDPKTGKKHWDISQPDGDNWLVEYNPSTGKPTGRVIKPGPNTPGATPGDFRKDFPNAKRTITAGNMNIDGKTVIAYAPIGNGVQPLGAARLYTTEVVNGKMVSHPMPIKGMEKHRKDPMFSWFSGFTDSADGSRNFVTKGPRGRGVTQWRVPAGKNFQNMANWQWYNQKTHSWVDYSKKPPLRSNSLVPGTEDETTPKPWYGQLKGEYPPKTALMFNQGSHIKMRYGNSPSDMNGQKDISPHHAKGGKSISQPYSMAPIDPEHATVDQMATIYSEWTNADKTHSKKRYGGFVNLFNDTCSG